MGSSTYSLPSTTRAPHPKDPPKLEEEFVKTFFFSSYKGFIALLKICGEGKEP